MKCLIVLFAVVACANAGHIPYAYGGLGHGYGIGHGYAVAAPVVAPAVIHKVPIATSYHHEHRTYHPVVPVVKHVPVVKAVYPEIHHAPAFAFGHGYGHGYGHDLGYAHGYGHGGLGGLGGLGYGGLGHFK